MLSGGAGLAKPLWQARMRGKWRDRRQMARRQMAARAATVARVRHWIEWRAIALSSRLDGVLASRGCLSGMEPQRETATRDLCAGDAGGGAPVGTGRAG